MNDKETVMKEARVDILDAATGDVIGHCNGPTPTGTCPDTEQDRAVPCQGCRIAPMNAGSEYWLMLVPPASRHCPQGWNLTVTY